MSEATPSERSSDSTTSEVVDDNTAASVAEIEAFAHSDRVEILMEVFDRGLSGEIDEHTFERVRDAGILLVGANGFSGLVWAADDREPADNIKALGLSPVAESWLIRVLALYGLRLREALHHSEVAASRRDDWEAFGRRILWDGKKNEYVISTEITKYNGEAIRIEAGLTSVVRFTERTIAMLLAVDDLSAITDSDRQLLKESLFRLGERLDAEVPSGGGSATSTTESS